MKHQLQTMAQQFGLTVDRIALRSRRARRETRSSIYAGAFAVFFVFLFSPGMTPHAYGHYLGESYLFLTIRDGGIDGHVDIPLAELGDVLFKGQVTDGILTPQEIEADMDRLVSYVTERVEVGTAESSFTMRFTTHKIMTSPEVPFVQLNFTIDGLQKVPKVLKVRYSVLFASDPRHRALLVVESDQIAGYTNAEEKVSLIFNKDNQTQELDISELSWFKLFVSYLEHGIYHIAIGLDHILFIVALLLSSVLERDNGRWVACSSFRRAFMNVVTIVTLFTIAHSITLGLAALNIVTLPTRFVESMIAATVVVAALHNIYPLIGKRIGPIIFLFGLFHGFGFASVLSGLGFQQYSLVATLLGFNLGVEIGQLVVVTAAFPLLYAFRSHRFYGRFGLVAGSSIITLLGAMWFLERTLGFEI